MASNYPGSLDSFDTIASDKKTSDAVGGRTHRQMHNDLGDAIEAVQTELGTTPSGSYDTVKARFEAIEGSTLPQVDAKGDLIVGTADNTYDNLGVGTNDTVLLAASGETKGVKWAQVPTAAIADGAVTAAKFAVQPGNLLTANQASIETDTTGWLAAADCTIARNAGVGGTHGAACLEATATSTADPVWWTTWITGIEAGDTYTAVMDIAATPNPAVIDYYIEWSDGSSTTGYAHAPAATAISASWTTMRATGVAPVTTTRARLVVIAANIAADDKFFCDRFGFWKGAGGVWALPGTPIVGLSSQATNNAVHLSGLGTPEGVITAAPGSTWLQTDSTTDVKGWIRWIKATGTGNTGWVAGPEADTGWRDVSSLLVNSWTGTSVLLRRVGDAVSFRATLNGTTASAVTALNLPVGFRPKSLFQVPVPRAATLSDSIVAEFVATDGAVVLWSGNGKGASQYVVGEFMTPANQSWPSSLPGSAA